MKRKDLEQPDQQLDRLQSELRDVPKVTSDLLPAFGIVRGVGPNLNEAAIFPEREMMRGFLTREAHGVIPTCIHAMTMV